MTSAFLSLKLPPMTSGLKEMSREFKVTKENLIELQGTQENLWEPVGTCGNLWEPVI